MFNLFKKKDPVCGMVKKEGTGFEENGEWFCSKDCLKEWKTNQMKQTGSQDAHKGRHGCC